MLLFVNCGKSALFLGDLVILELIDFFEGDGEICFFGDEGLVYCLAGGDVIFKGDAALGFILN